MNDPRYIIVHHSLTKDGDTAEWEAIRRYHMDAYGWDDIGYHAGIEMVDGKLMVRAGRKDHVVGAHTKELGMNAKSIGICIVGNFDLAPPPDEYTALLVQLCHAYMVNYGVKTANVLGHREVGLMAGYDWRKGEYKTCPGRSFSMDELRKKLG